MLKNNFSIESLILGGNQMKTEHKNSTPSLFPLGNDETMPLMYLQIEDENEVFLSFIFHSHFKSHRKQILFQYILMMIHFQWLKDIVIQKDFNSIGLNLELLLQLLKSKSIVLHKQLKQS